VVGDVLAGVVGRAGSNVIYAAGTAAMLRVVADYCRRQNIPSQVAIEEAMGCGWGQCFTCVVPVARKDGSGTDYLRSCTDGPVFNSSRIAWDLFAPGPVDISEAPEDTGDVP
jgi:dihydroorotate dehydrogenase electron transfer subunit